MRTPTVLVLLSSTLLAGSAELFAQQGGYDASASSYAARHEWWVMNPDGCSLYVAEFGQGPPLVIVHGGFGAEHSYLLDAFSGLASQYRLVFYDQRGSLRSPYRVYEKGGSEVCPDSLVTVSNHITDLERVRRELGFDKMTLIAHSMGAFLALSYLERFPERVAGLVLLASGVPLKPVQNKQLLSEQKAAANALFERPEIEAEKKKAGVDRAPLSDKQKIDEWRIRYASANLYDVSKWRQLRGGMAFYNSRAGSAAAKSMPQTYDFVAVLRSRSCPASVIVGDHDISDMGARLIREQSAGVPQIDLTVIKNAGHALWVDQPDAFSQAMGRALKLCV
jgi:pimeloyl-ACP methyl ester carboxylesterase